MAGRKQRSLKQILMSGLGRSWMSWPPRNEVKRRCKHPTKPGWYICEICKAEREKIDIDHINPVVPVQEGFTGWDAYIASKFVPAESLQGICRECHREKTQKENRERRAFKRLNKEKHRGKPLR